MLRSGNDTAVALAEHLSGSVEKFSELMNQKAKEIGLKNSNFVTPHGLDDDEHYTTAYDLAILTNYALKNKVFLKIVGTKQITINVGNSSRTLNNTNELLDNVNGELVFSKDGDKIWKCRNCGHIVVGKYAPDICPVCNHPKAYFEVKAENY